MRKGLLDPPIALLPLPVKTKPQLKQNPLGEGESPQGGLLQVKGSPFLKAVTLSGPSSS